MHFSVIVAVAPMYACTLLSAALVRDAAVLRVEAQRQRRRRYQQVRARSSLPLVSCLSNRPRT